VIDKRNRAKSHEKRNKANNTNNIQFKNNKSKIQKNKSLENFPTTHQYNKKHKKFNEEEFQKTIKSFNDWENKKNEKIKKKQLEKQKKEQKEYNKKNIHHNKHLSNMAQSKVIDRLYREDIKKRKEKKQTLLKIYECTFQPNIYKYKNDLNITDLGNKKSSFLLRVAKNKNNYNNLNSENKSMILKSNKKHNGNKEYDSTSKAKKKEITNYQDSSENNSGSDIDNDEENLIANKLRAKLFMNKKQKHERNNISVRERKKLKFKI